MTLLYKYMSLDALKASVSTNTIGFSCAENLNDIFELGGGKYLSSCDKTDMTHGAYSNLSRSFGILSLTRTYLNPMMWTMYADGHRGGVVAFDPEEACLSDNCILPYKSGGVIYTKTNPGNIIKAILGDFSPIKNIKEKYSHHSLSEDEKEIINSFFLHKSDIWSHEEEVRVVKNITDVNNYVSHYCNDSQNHKNGSGCWEKILIPDYPGTLRPLHCFSLPEFAIKKIYLGAKAHRGLSFDRREAKKLIQPWIDRGIPVLKVGQTRHSWELHDAGEIDEF